MYVRAQGLERIHEKLLSSYQLWVRGTEGMSWGPGGEESELALGPETGWVRGGGV